MYVDIPSSRGAGVASHLRKEDIPWTSGSSWTLRRFIPHRLQLCSGYVLPLVVL